MVPFFSVIIPVYNVAPYLRECFDSVLSQTFTNWEAICVDDGSTDGSGAILDEYAARDSRFRVIHQINAGVSVARNNALEIAMGSYIAFLDGDDIIDKNLLYVFSKVIDEEGCDIVRIVFRLWNHEKEPIATSCKGFHIVARYKTMSEVRAWGVSEALKNGYSWLNCIRKDIVGEVRFPIDIRMMEDNIFSAAIMTYAHSAVVTDFDGYLYRARGTSAVHVFSKSQSMISVTNKFIVALGKFLDDCRNRPDVQTDYDNIAGASTECIANCIRTCCVARWHAIVNPGNSFKELQKTVLDLYDNGALNFSLVPFFKRLPTFVFMKNGNWFVFLILWKTFAVMNMKHKALHVKSVV